jgi:release factor glutamine methyltransferase
MAGSASSSTEAVVGRLRAAGCVFAEEEARLLVGAARTPGDLGGMVERRVAGMPLEHVLGWADFCGVRIAVDPGVFIPRRRTEFLVEQAVGLARGAAGGDGLVGGLAGIVVVDLCCGSGAVGVALASALGGGEVHAVDIDPVAVRCARHNLAGVGGHVYEGDLFQPLPGRLRGRVNLLAANVPYVPSGEVGLLPPEARLHESRVALDGGADGLEVLRRVAAMAGAWLAPGGSVLSETSERQGPRALEVLAASSLIPRLAASDALNATVVIGTR